MVSREVEDFTKQQRIETERAVNLFIKQVQDTINTDLQKIIAGVASTDAKETQLAAESERALTLVSAESEKFAAKVAADKTEMDSREETFRLAGVKLETQLSEGLGKIKAAQAAADAANLMQSESTRAAIFPAGQLCAFQFFRGSFFLCVGCDLVDSRLKLVKKTDRLIPDIKRACDSKCRLYVIRVRLSAICLHDHALYI